MSDSVNHPSHYHSEYWHSKCGKTVECIDIVRHMDFSLGNAVKYIWRAGKKDDELEDLRKANWYIADRICELERELAAKQGLIKKVPAYNRTLDDPLHKCAQGLCDDHAGPVIMDCDKVIGGPDEFWVMYVHDERTANDAWATFNQDDFYLEHPQRQAIRDSLLGLISQLPTSAHEGLAPWVREAADDWTYAAAARKDGY